MKNLISTCIAAILFAASGLSQINESFFETLGNGSSYNGIGYFGIKTQTGALAVKIADSLDTEVQWVKYNFDGNYELFSANLPSNSISPNERIIQLFESGNNQFLVTNDSASYAPKGIRIHKYENYTQNAGYFEYPSSFSWKNFQAYFRNGKIFVFFINAAKQVKRLIIDANTLTLEEDLVLGSDPSFSEGQNNFFKSIHVEFQASGDMSVYANSGTRLVRINVVNNVGTLETREMRLKKVLGIDTVNNRLICLKNYNGNDLYRYELNASIPLDNIQAIDSIKLPGNTPQSLKDWNYVTDGTTEFLTNGSGSLRYLTISGNQITAQDSVAMYYRITNTELLYGLPMVFGARVDNFSSGSSSTVPSFLFITYGEINHIFKFREYSSIYNFGNYKTRFGIGNQLIVPVENRATGDFIFNNQIFFLGQSFTGKESEQIKGFHETVYSQNYKPGPYTQPNEYSQEIVHEFNENFYVDLTMLNQHVASIGNTDYIIPKSILNWPAHGDVSKGQAVNLAPFMDLNNNGTYEPTQGEYPVFPGTHCLLNITHQHQNDFNSKGSGLELHTYMYNFTCEDSISDVIFLKTEVYNRGNINYDSLASGLSAEFDLGGFFDDYIGTHVENGLIYCYNADNYDEDYEGNLGFHDSLPTIAVQFLKGTQFAPNSQDDQDGIGLFQTVNGTGFGDGVIDNEFKGLEYSNYYMNFESPEQEGSERWFHMLNGRTHLGDTTFYSSTQIPSRYYFPDDSDPLFYGTYGIDPGFNWSESQTTAGGISNPPGDRRIMGSFGSSPLASGNKITYHSAIFSGKRVPGAGQSQIDLFAKAKHVRKAFDQNQTSCGQTFGNTTQDQVTSLPENKAELDVKVYPNPFSNEVYIVVESFEKATLHLFDVNGKMIASEKITSNKHLINTSSMDKGIYFLTIESEKGNVTKKIVRQ